MADYCKPGDKPIVKYKFGTGKWRYFKSKFSPIEVEIQTQRIGSTSNINNEGFKLRVYSTNNFGYIEFIVTDYKFVDNPGSSFPYILFAQTCGSKKMTSQFNADPNTVTIDPTVKCPTPIKQRCALIVRHKGIIIFQDQGDCPCELEVQCGDCSPNSIKCETDKYPGYCCTPCSDIANKINKLASTIR